MKQSKWYASEASFAASTGTKRIVNFFNQPKKKEKKNKNNKKKELKTFH